MPKRRRRPTPARQAVRVRQAEGRAAPLGASGSVTVQGRRPRLADILQPSAGRSGEHLIDGFPAQAARGSSRTRGPLRWEDDQVARCVDPRHGVSPRHRGGEGARRRPRPQMATVEGRGVAWSVGQRVRGHGGRSWRVRIWLSRSSIRRRLPVDIAIAVPYIVERGFGQSKGRDGRGLELLHPLGLWDWLHCGVAGRGGDSALRTADRMLCVFESSSTGWDEIRQTRAASRAGAGRRQGRRWWFNEVQAPPSREVVSLLYQETRHRLAEPSQGVEESGCQQTITRGRWKGAIRSLDGNIWTGLYESGTGVVRESGSEGVRRGEMTGCRARLCSGGGCTMRVGRGMDRTGQQQRGTVQ